MNHIEIRPDLYMVHRFNDEDLSTHNQQCSPNEDLACYNNLKANTIWKDEEILVSTARQQEKELADMVSNEQSQDKIDKDELGYKPKKLDKRTQIILKACKTI